MNILLANNPREKYAVGDTIPGTLNNGMMESAAKLIPKVEEMLPKLDSILIACDASLSLGGVFPLSCQFRLVSRAEVERT